MNCPFADPGAPPTKSMDSDSTEVLGNQISRRLFELRFYRSLLRLASIPSFSSPTSLDSINDDFFRTPPENVSLSSAADSEPRVRISELKLREGSNLKSPSSKTTPFSENVRVLETKRYSDSGVVVPLSSPPSVVSDDARVPAKHPDFDSPSPTAIERTIVLENQPNSDSVANSGLSETSETEDSGGDLPFKEIIEALLRNNGENLNERDEKVSYVDILKQYGLKFP